MAETVRKNLGMVTAYAYAVSKGYSGTEEEFAELMASYADVAQDAETSAQVAAQSATTAEQKATQAAGSATNAAVSATSASESAQAAAGSSNSANLYAQDASASATNAAGSASSASTYAGNASASSQDAEGSANAAQASATQAAGSATTATAKAGEAATSATTAVEAAQRAEDAAATLVIDDTLTHAGQAADAKKTGDEIGDLKENLTDVDDRLTTLDGKIVAEWEIGQRYVNNGQDALANTSTRIRTKAGTYLQFKSGEIIALKNLQEYQFYIGYSTDGGSTFQATGNREHPYTFTADAVGFLCVLKKTGTFTESEMNDVVNNKMIYIIPNTDLVHKNSDSIDALTLGNANFGGFDLIASKSGITDQWIGAGLTNYNSAATYCDDIPASKGDVFLISAEESVSYPSLFTSIGLAVYELNSEGTSVRTASLIDISSPVKYIVNKENTTKLRIFGNLKAESTSVTTGYRETFEYKLNVLKQLSASGIDKVLTEAGDIWEV